MLWEITIRLKCIWPKVFLAELLPMFLDMAGALGLEAQDFGAEPLAAYQPQTMQPIEIQQVTGFWASSLGFGSDGCIRFGLPEIY